MLLSEDGGKTWRDTGSFAAIPGRRTWCDVGICSLAVTKCSRQLQGSCRPSACGGPASNLGGERASCVMLTTLSQGAAPEASAVLHARRGLLLNQVEAADTPSCLSCPLPKQDDPTGLPLQAGSPVLLQVLPSQTQGAARAEHRPLS